MTRREWVLSAGMGLMAGMAPACSHTGDHAPLTVSPGGSGLVVPADPRPILADAAPRPADTTTTGSLLRSDTRINGPAVEQARFPAGPSLGRPASGPASRQEQQPDDPVAPIPAGSSCRTEIKTTPVEDPPLVAALRCYLNKKPAEAVIWLERYDRLNQDLLLCLLPLMARLSEQGLQHSDKRDLANVVAQLDRLANLLRPSAQLVIDKMCFCNRIETYGDYHALDEDRAFQPGDVVHVYVELENFSSFVVKDRDIDKRYCIQLASRVEIRDFKGQLAWCTGLKDADLRDESLTPRHDFFISYPLQVPHIPPGPYTLRLIVMDVPTKRRAEHTLDFRIITARGCEPYGTTGQSEPRQPDAIPARISNCVREGEL
jgi:hypothetical protein